MLGFVSILRNGFESELERVKYSQLTKCVTD